MNWCYRLGHTKFRNHGGFEIRAVGEPELCSRHGNGAISARQSGVRVPAVAIDISVLQMSRPTVGPSQPPFRRPVGYGENSTQFIPESKIECSYTTGFLKLCGQECLHA